MMQSPINIRLENSLNSYKPGETAPDKRPNETHYHTTQEGEEKQTPKFGSQSLFGLGHAVSQVKSLARTVRVYGTCEKPKPPRPYPEGHFNSMILFSSCASPVRRPFVRTLVLFKFIYK